MYYGDIISDSLLSLCVISVTYTVTGGGEYKDTVQCLVLDIIKIAIFKFMRASRWSSLTHCARTLPAVKFKIVGKPILGEK